MMAGKRERTATESLLQIALGIEMAIVFFGALALNGLGLYSGLVVVVGATVAFIAGASALGWVLTLIVAGLAALAAVTGVCVGCEMYVMAAKLRRR